MLLFKKKSQKNELKGTDAILTINIFKRFHQNGCENLLWQRYKPKVIFLFYFTIFDQSDFFDSYLIMFRSSQKIFTLFLLCNCNNFLFIF